MLSSFICGSSFHNQEDEDDHSPCSTPRKSRKSSSKDKNPYATRGLDKFSVLLADLEEKRRKIYSQLGSQDISLVRFVYSSSNDCVPIIVKLKDKKRTSLDKEDQIKDNAETKEKSHAEVNQEDQQTRLESEKKKEKKKKVTWELKLHRLRRPSYYMPVFMILILLFLAFFGRSVAILCTSIGWYLVPTLSSKRPTNPAEKKKQLMRRYSEIGPRSKNIINGDHVKDKTNHGRQNSF